MARGRYCGMARKPEPAKPITWNVYKIASKVVWLGAVEASDETDAMEKGSAEFNVPALMAITVITSRRGPRGPQDRPEGIRTARWGGSDRAGCCLRADLPSWTRRPVGSLFDVEHDVVIKLGTGSRLRCDACTYGGAIALRSFISALAT
jgi:hypothetical protein